VTRPRVRQRELPREQRRPVVAGRTRGPPVPRPGLRSVVRGRPGRTRGGESFERGVISGRKRPRGRPAGPTGSRSPLSRAATPDPRRRSPGPRLGGIVPAGLLDAAVCGAIRSAANPSATRAGHVCRIGCSMFRGRAVQSLSAAITVSTTASVSRSRRSPIRSEIRFAHSCWDARSAATALRPCGVAATSFAR
jgi:hypothetical protein